MSVDEIQFMFTWETYSDHLKQLMQKLIQSNESADVTLVCDDKTKFKAHKFILSACSPVFQSMIAELPQKENSVIFLKGVLACEIKSILQFMYLGQTTFDQGRMNEFLEVAKSLKVNELSNDDDGDTMESRIDDVEAIIESKTSKSYGKETNENEPNITKEVIGQRDTKIMVSHSTENGLFKCPVCEKQFNDKANTYRHVKSIHDGMKFHCSQCIKSFTQKCHLESHVKAVHDGMKFECDFCEYEASQKANLHTHKKKKHPELYKNKRS